MPIVASGTAPSYAVPAVVNIADLRRLAAGAFPVVMLEGTGTAGDGGGGFFYWSQSSVAADDSSLVVAPSSGVTGRWLRLNTSAVGETFTQSGTGAVSRDAQAKMRDYLTGADFGVVADGVTDDTTAIANTLAAAVSQKKRAVFTGPMLISSTIAVSSPVHIVMTGAPGELTHAPDTYFLKKSTMTTSGVTVTAFGVVWEGGGVDGNKAAGATGDNITIQGRSFTGRKVCSRNSGGNNWVIGKSTDNTNADFPMLYDCVGYAATTDNLQINSNNGATPEANNGTIINFLADSAGRHNIGLLSCQGITLVNCNGTSGARGLYLDRAAYTVVDGGEFTGNSTADIEQTANAQHTNWQNVPPSMVIVDGASSANKSMRLHRTGLDKNLVAMDGVAAGAVRVAALNDAQNAAVPFELQGSTFRLIGGATTIDGFTTITGGVGSNVAPSSAWGIDQTSSNNLVTIANNGTYDLATGSGLVILQNDNISGNIGFFICAAGVTTELSDPGGVYTTTSANPGTTNFFYNGGTTKYRIENKSGVSVNYYITTIRTRNNV